MLSDVRVAAATRILRMRWPAASRSITQTILGGQLHGLAATRLLARLSAYFTPRAPARVRHSPT
jgi:hypothetical protein